MISMVVGYFHFRVNGNKAAPRTIDRRQVGNEVGSGRRISKAATASGAQPPRGPGNLHHAEGCGNDGPDQRPQALALVA